MIGNNSPDAVCSCTEGIGFGLMPVNFCALSCDKRDTDEPESSMISVLIPPTLPTILASCDLMVATTMVFLGLTDNGDACCPLQTSLVRFPASTALQNGPVDYRCNIFDLWVFQGNSVEYVPVCYSKNNA